MALSDALPIIHPKSLARLTISRVTGPGGSPVSKVPSISKLNKIFKVGSPNLIAVFLRKPSDCNKQDVDYNNSEY